MVFALIWLRLDHSSVLDEFTIVHLLLLWRMFSSRLLCVSIVPEVTSLDTYWMAVESNSQQNAPVKEKEQRSKTFTYVVGGCHMRETCWWLHDRSACNNECSRQEANVAQTGRDGILPFPDVKNQTSYSITIPRINLPLTRESIAFFLHPICI